MQESKKRFQEVSDKIYEEFIKNKKDNLIIPSENTLASTYKVSRTTIRKALAELIEKNYIQSVHGSGYYINPPKHISSLNFMPSFLDLAKSKGKVSSSRVVKFQIEPADSYYSDKLGIKEGDSIYYVERLRLLGDKVYSFDIMYIPLALFSDLSIDILRNSLYEYVTQIKKLKIEEHYVEISATFVPRQDIAEMINVEMNTPMTLANITSTLSTGEVFEYVKTFKNPLEHKYLVNIKH